MFKQRVNIADESTVVEGNGLYRLLCVKLAKDKCIVLATASVVKEAKKNLILVDYADNIVQYTLIRLSLK